MDQASSRRNINKEVALSYLGPRHNLQEHLQVSHDRVESRKSSSKFGCSNNLKEGSLLPVKNLSILIASKGQILGLEDILNGRRLTTSVKCITKKGSILKIKKEEFLRIIQKDNKSLKYLEGVKESRDENTIGKLKLAR